MKKLIVLLLAIAMAGAAFAQTPTLSASATLSFGVDLDTMQSGFKNECSATVTIPFTVADAAKKGESGWWGEIAVSNITFELTDDPTAIGGFSLNDTDADGNPATLTAKITNGVWALSVYSAKSPDFDVALDLGDTTSTVIGAFDAVGNGTSLSYSAGALSAGVISSSKSDWTTNTKNEFALGGYADYTLNENIKVGGKVGYDLTDADKEFVIAGTAEATYGDLSSFIGSDIDLTGPTVNYDVRGDVEYSLLEGVVVPAFAVYYDKKDIDARVAAYYEKDAVEAGLAFTDENLLKKDTQAYVLDIYAGYTYSLAETTTIYMRADYSNDLTGKKGSLIPYVQLKDTSIANTTLTLTWNALASATPAGVDVLAGNWGALVAAAKISL